MTRPALLSRPNPAAVAAAKEGWCGSLLTALIGWIIIGILAGWLAGLVVGDMIVGVIGALIGGFLVQLLLHNPSGANGGFIRSLVVSFVGAVILLLIVRAATGGRRGRAAI